MQLPVEVNGTIMNEGVKCSEHSIAYKSWIITDKLITDDIEQDLEHYEYNLSYTEYLDFLVNAMSFLVVIVCPFIGLLQFI